MISCEDTAFFLDDEVRGTGFRVLAYIIHEDRQKSLKPLPEKKYRYAIRQKNSLFFEVQSSSGFYKLVNKALLNGGMIPGISETGKPDLLSDRIDREKRNSYRI